jgi:hypothetical protein
MKSTDKMSENLKKYRDRVERVHSDWTMSEEAKRQDLTAAYTEARTTHDLLADEYRGGVKERPEKTRSAAFSAPKVGKDPALDVLVYRDALDRVSKTLDQRELTDTLARARMTGDAALAKAVLYRGYELQNANLVGAYLESYPEHRAVWDEFMEAAEAHNELEVMGVSVPEPEEPQELRGVGVAGAA